MALKQIQINPGDHLQNLLLSFLFLWSGACQFGCYVCRRSPKLATENSRGYLQFGLFPPSHYFCVTRVDIAVIFTKDQASAVV